MSLELQLIDNSIETLVTQVTQNLLYVKRN